MIICITGDFDVYDRNGHKTGKKELLVSHGVDFVTGKTVILPTEHPSTLGCVLIKELNEYVLFNNDDERKYYGF